MEDICIKKMKIKTSFWSFFIQIVEQKKKCLKNVLFCNAASEMGKCQCSAPFRYKKENKKRQKKKK